jgi:hypothetical protein
MSETVVDPGRFTVGVFQDLPWAERGVDALLRHAFPPASLTILAQDSTGADALIRSRLGADPDRLTLPGVGTIVARGPLVGVLQGTDGALNTQGIAATMRRVGFQTHDGYIFETLTGRGGVLVAIHTEPRAADALAVLHAYGGGNAAIGAWTGRL